jgi:hypothetical protein
MIYLGDALLGLPMNGSQWASLLFELAVCCIFTAFYFLIDES